MLSAPPRLRAMTCPFVTAGLVVIVACGGGEAPRDAAGPPDAGAIRPVEPALPTLTPCPTGWRETSVEGLTRCEPGALAAACPHASMQRPGGDGCEPVDDACVEGAVFRAGLDATRTLRFVREGASGGDGTERSPLGTIAEALAGVTGPVTIALAEGRYETTTLGSDVALVGVCASRVTLTHGPDAPALLVRSGQRLALEGVSIAAEDVAILAGGEVSLLRVAIEGAHTAGIGLIGGTLEAERVLVRDTQLDADGRFGRGVSLESGAHAVLRDVVLEASHDAAIGAAASSLEAEGLAVRVARPNGAGRYGQGLALFEGASATVRHALVEDATDACARVEGGGTLTLEDVVLRDCAADAREGNGFGLRLDGAQAFVRRVWIERATDAAVYVSGASALEATDLVCTGTRPTADGYAAGLAVVDGATASLARVAVHDSAWMGVLTLGAGSRLVAEDLLVRGVREGHDLGEGLVAAEGASVEVTRGRIEDVLAVGVAAFQPGSTLRLSHGTIAHVGETAAYLVGRGAEADVGAHLALTDVWIEDVVETGVVSFGNLEAGTEVLLEDVRVRDIRERSCAATSCPTEGGGSGVAAVFGGIVTARGLEVSGAPLCGVQVAEGASLDVESGAISGSAIGACVQIDGYDLGRVVTGVTFRDNDRNVETTRVYVPGAGPR